jgi:hypothetical protein
MTSLINRGLGFGALMIVGVGAVSSAHAQNAAGTTDRKFRLTCQDDYETFCSGGQADPIGLEKACLRQSYVNLSAACKRALGSQPRGQTDDNTQ